MTQYPVQFDSVTESACGIESRWSSKSGNMETSIAIPPEFEGPGLGLSPEDLFNQALTNCFVATFKVYAEKSRLTFERISVSSRLVVDFDDARKPVMKELHLTAQIVRPSNADKALLLAKKASQSGFILNSVKTECHFNFEIT